MKKRLWRSLALLLLPVLLLAGCLEDPSPDTDTLLPLTEEEEADPLEPAEPKVVLPDAFALPYNPSKTLDPVTCPDGVQQTIGALVYEGLFQLDQHMQPQPRLCSQYAYDPAALTYTFTLRPGVVFSDGSPLTAEDAAATLRRAQISTRYGSRLRGVKSIAASGGSLVIALHGPNTGFPALLDIPIVKAGTEFSPTPIGTGAYAVGDAGTALIANPLWWGGRQPLDRIELSAADNRENVLYQFTSHDVQLIAADLTGTSPISASGNVIFQEADTTVLQYLGFNLRRAPFDDAAVRRALGQGINRAPITSAFLSGHGQPAQFPVSPASSLYPEDLEALYSYDAFAAAMAAAGLSSGRSRTVTLLVNTENSFKTAVAEYLAETLSPFDLKLRVHALPWPDYLAALKAGNFDLYYGEVRLSPDWNLAPLLGTGGALNYGRWSDPYTDQLLTAFMVSADRPASMSALCAHIGQQAPIIPLCFKSTSVLVQTGVMENLKPTMADPFFGLTDLTFHLKDGKDR